MFERKDFSQKQLLSTSGFHTDRVDVTQYKYVTNKPATLETEMGRYL